MHHSTACTLITRPSSTSQSANNHSIIAVAAGFVTVAVAKAADTDNMSQVNSNDTASVKPSMTSHSSDYETMDAAATILTLSFTAPSSSINAADAPAPALDATSTPAPSLDAVAASAAAGLQHR